MASDGFFVVLCLVSSVMNSVNGSWRPQTEAVKCVHMGDGFVRPNAKLDGWRPLANTVTDTNGSGINVGSGPSHHNKNFVLVTHNREYNYPSAMWHPNENGAPGGHGGHGDLTAMWDPYGNGAGGSHEGGQGHPPAMWHPDGNGATGGSGKGQNYSNDKGALHVVNLNAVSY